jgi:hypothetical protein
MLMIIAAQLLASRVAGSRLSESTLLAAVWCRLNITVCAVGTALKHASAEVTRDYSETACSQLNVHETP